MMREGVEQGGYREEPRRGFAIVYRQVFQVPQTLHLEPSLDALSLRSDAILAIQILSCCSMWSFREGWW